MATTINALIKNGLKDIGVPVVPDYYDGTRTEYIVFNFMMRPYIFSDDFPYSLICEITVHYVCPPKKNAIATRENIIRAIYELDGTYPEETNASTEDEQHYIYEFEIAGDTIV